MTRSISKGEWHLISRSVDERLIWERKKQEQLVRFCLMVLKDELEGVRLAIEQGMVVDQLLVENPDMGATETGQRLIEQAKVTSSISPLGLAASKNQIGMVRMLLDAGLASPGMAFGRGRDAAWIAMEHQAWDVYLMLMDRGVSVDLRLPGSRETRLIEAVKRSSLAYVRDLLARRANVKAYDHEGRTPLHHNLAKTPYEGVDVDIGRLLIDYGGDPNVLDQRGLPAHALATSQAAEALLEKHRLMEITREMLQTRQQELEEKAEAELDLNPEPHDPYDPLTPQLHRQPRKPKARPIHLEDQIAPVEFEPDEPTPPPSTPSRKHRI